MLTGCYTALATPFNGDAVDYEGLSRLTRFQIENGITGILAVGTTGESPTLTWDEHNKTIESIAEKTRGKCLCIAGTGSNNTDEALSATRHAVAAGVDAVLLVDPYYNGPSSQEIRKEYIEPIAKGCPEVEIIPYIIPGRTGAQMLPEDLAILAGQYKNINTVKEATGNLDNMKRTRACCGDDFTILSGDDSLVYDMMKDPAIKAAGCISVASNIAPGPMTEMIRLAAEGDTEGAEKLFKALTPLFDIVTVTTEEITPFGTVNNRARNPLALKTLMAIIGMPSGGCRRPLGKMTRKGVDKVLEIGRTLQASSPEILAPVAEFFNVDIDARLADPASCEGLFYEAY